MVDGGSPQEEEQRLWQTRQRKSAPNQPLIRLVEIPPEEPKAGTTGNCTNTTNEARLPNYPFKQQLVLTFINKGPA